MRVKIFTANDGRCDFCGQKIQIGQRWEVSHRRPLELGGTDTPDNMFPACYPCHREHTAKVDLPAIAKAKRREAIHLGAKATSKRPIPGSRASGWKRHFDGSVSRREP